MIIKSIAEVRRVFRWHAMVGLDEYSVGFLKFRFGLLVWFWTMHFPYILKAFAQSFYRPLHKNIMYNHAVYDGQTRNDFEIGSLLQFVHQLGGIKQLPYSEDDGRGYYIGFSDEDD